MPNRFKKVNDGIYRGGAPSKRDLGLLSNKVNRVISLDKNVASYISPRIIKILVLIIRKVMLKIV